MAAKYEKKIPLMNHLGEDSTCLGLGSRSPKVVFSVETAGKSGVDLRDQASASPQHKNKEPLCALLPGSAAISQRLRNQYEGYGIKPFPLCSN